MKWRKKKRRPVWGPVMLLAACAGLWVACKKSTSPASSEPAQSAAASLPKVEGKKIYFVAIGDFPERVAQDLVGYYRQKYNLEIQVLKTIPADPQVFDASRQQVKAEPLVASLHGAFPEVTHNPGAVLIGFTMADIYPISMNWQFAFGWRNGDLHTAVVSAARMNLHYAGEPADVAKPEVRVRKMTTKDIGLLYYGLPQSDNPHNVLYNQIGGIEELDQVGEDF